MHLKLEHVPSKVFEGVFQVVQSINEGFISSFNLLDAITISGVSDKLVSDLQLSGVK